MPSDLDVLKKLAFQSETCHLSKQVENVLSESQNAKLDELVNLIREGKGGVIIVDQKENKTKYGIFNTARGKATSLMGRVIEAIARRLS